MKIKASKIQERIEVELSDNDMFEVTSEYIRKKFDLIDGCYLTDGKIHIDITSHTFRTWLKTEIIDENPTKEKIAALEFLALLRSNRYTT